MEHDCREIFTIVIAAFFILSSGKFAFTEPFVDIPSLINAYPCAYFEWRKRHLKRLLLKIFPIIMALMTLGAAFRVSGVELKKSGQPAQTCLLGVRIEIDTLIDRVLVAHFRASLFGALEQKFTNINLCVDTCRSGCVESGHGGVDLKIGYEPEEDSTIYCGSIVVTFEKTGGEENTEHDGNQVLTLFQVPAGIDRDGLYMVVAEKIVENIRREVLGEVKVGSLPQGAFFTIDSTLGRNKAPKTLLLPPGTYTVEARLPKYLPYRRAINVSAPGVTELTIELTKRRFYHSRYMPMLYIFGAAAAGAFGCEWYLYDQYSKLNESDFRGRPGEFEKRFDRAKNFEYTGITLLGLTSASLMITFFY